MALAYGDFHELSHQLRFLLFEIGIGLPQNSIDYFITLAHKNTLKRLQYAALAEGLINTPIPSHHVHDFIDQLQLKLKYTEPASQFFHWNYLRNEADESIANEALAHAYKQRWDGQIVNEISPYGSLWSWINNKQNTAQSLFFLEQWGAHGHPLHPTFGAKMGFTRREVLQNSPEFQAQICLHWCALSKTQATQSGNFNRLMAQEFPKEFQFWQEKLRLNHLNPEEYLPVPVHPWQWRNKVQVLCRQLIDDRSLILLPHHQIVLPSMAYNTMMPQSHSNTHIKLALDIQTPHTPRIEQSENSSYRTALSQWVHSLLKQSDNYQHTLFLAAELAEINLNTTAMPNYNQKQLAASLIRNPMNLIKAEQKVIPLVSLFANSPLSNKPLLIDLIKASGLSPLTYFNQYCHKVLFSQLHLLLKYGIAFESQPHNTLVVFADHQPQGLIIRDIEEIKIAYSVLYESVDRPNLPDPSSMKTNNLDTLRASFIRGALQNNISYWINSLTKEYPLKVPQLWKVVHEVIQKLLNKLPKDSDPRILCWQKHQLLHDLWQDQCLLTARLKGNSNKNSTVSIPNPLNKTS